MLDAIQAVEKLGKVEKDKEAAFISEKLKSHAKQLLILMPNIRTYLISPEESKLEEDQRNGHFATLIGRMRDEMREVQEKNERLMRDLHNERENQRTREEIKMQSKRNIEEAKSRFDQIQLDMRK